MQPTHRLSYWSVFAVTAFSLVGMGFFIRHLSQSYVRVGHRFSLRHKSSVPHSFVPTPIPTPSPTAPIELMAWLAWWDHAQTLYSLQANHSSFTTISPSWYHLNDTGQVQKLAITNPAPISNLATSSGLLVMPTVGNDLDSTKVTTFLSDTNNYFPAIDFLTTEAIAKGYMGYDVDFESIPPELTSAYTQFLSQLADTLHASNLALSVAVHARTGSTEDWELALSHDYAAIGQIADQVRLMAYDFHYAGSAPGPITPTDKLKQVITYALTHIPQDKIVLGLPLYGYDWPENDTGVSLTYKQVQDRLSQAQATRSRDPSSQAMIGTYTENETLHTIWYEDAHSTLSKINIAQAIGITRFVFWRLGDEDPDTWPLIATSTAILKNSPVR